MRKGILLLGGMGKRFLPATSIINKHLIPIIDRPMFHFSLSTLILAGINKINIISNQETLNLIKNSIDKNKLKKLYTKNLEQTKAGLKNTARV